MSWRKVLILEQSEFVLALASSSSVSIVSSSPASSFRSNLYPVLVSLLAASFSCSGSPDEAGKLN